MGTAFAPGRTPTRHNDIDAIAWNNNVAHILASGSSEGTSIWDLKNRKEVLHLNFQSPTGTSSRNLISSIAWHPDNSTTLITASSDENSPVILLWDLRNANAPQRVIQAHDKGVLSIDWCKQDSSFLLSSGKDNKTLLWNPLTGEKLGDYPVTSNWNFQTSFNPNIPDIFASASFDGKISVQTLQDTNSKDETQKKGEGDDFWNSNSYIDAQHPTVSLKKAPKWLVRPCSVSFGFGGKIVSVKKTGDKQSVVSISKFSGDESLISDTSKLASALNSDSVLDIISKQIEESKGSENFDWSVLLAISTSDPKKAVEQYIGEEQKDSESEESKDEEKTEKKTESNDGGLFGENTTTEDEFLSSISLNKGYEPSGTFKIFDPKYSPVEKSITEAILTGDLEKAVKIALKEDMLSEAFSIACSSTDSVRNLVQSAYLSKNAESKPYLRLLNSISSNDLTDVVKNSGIDEWKIALKTILNLSKDSATFKQLTSLLGERLLEARSSLSDPTSEEAIELRNNAVLCFLASEDLAKVSSVWIKEISDKEASLLKDSSNELTPYAAHVKALHAFIEKITIFRKASKSIGNDSSDDLAPLYDIYRDYANIVATQGQLDLAQTFLNFLPDKYASLERDRVSKANKNGTTASAKPKTLKPATNTYGAYGTSSSLKYSAKPAAANPFGASTATTSTPAAAPSASGPTSGLKSPYAPASATPSNPYAPPPVTTQPPTGLGYQPAPRSPAPKFQPGHNKTPSGIYPPPNPIIDSYQPVESYKKANTISPPPTGPPPTSSQLNPNKAAGGWNDLPSSAIPPPRKVTPAAPAATGSPFGFGTNPYAPGPAPPSTYGRQTPAQLGPPPTGPVAKSEPPTMAASSSMSTPSNPTTDKYAPVKPTSPQLPKAAPHSGTGAYGEPPRNFATPPVNPYAAPSITSPPPPNPYAPKVGAGQPQGYNTFQSPPTNGYGGAPTQVAASIPSSNPYAPAPGAQSQVPPPIRPSSGFGASSAYPPQVGGYAPQPIQPQQPQPPAQPEPEPEPEKPAAPKYPPGDRSHISETARPIFEILSQRLEEVKPNIPPSYQRQVQDAEKRLNLLFDHLNNEDLLSQDTITDLLALSQALQNNDFETASEIHLSILTTRSDECGHWMVGLKRLIDISRVLYTTAMSQQY